MKMDKPQAVLHLLTLQKVEGLEQFTGGESKLAAVAAGFFPLAATTAGQLNANVNIWLYFQSFCYGDYKSQFIEFFHHIKDAFTHFLGPEGSLDVVLVLVPIT